MKIYDEENLAKRQPGAKTIKRRPIISVGPNEQWSLDGHDKMKNVGPGMGVYGIRDVYSGRFLSLVLLPSNRKSKNIHWVYLEAVYQCKGESSQKTAKLSYRLSSPACDRQGIRDW